MPLTRKVSGCTLTVSKTKADFVTGMNFFLRFGRTGVLPGDCAWIDNAILQQRYKTSSRHIHQAELYGLKLAIIIGL